MGIRETMASFFLFLAIGFFFGYFIFRPLIALGDIPGEIKKLRESVDKLTKEIKDGNNKKNS